jgi:hypothetical protein
MSNALAVATVTTAIAQIVRAAAQSAVSGSDVLTERPDTAALTQPRVRLFLYQIAPNAALRNNDLPARAADGTAVRRPVAAIDLHYMLVFYGNETNLEPQRMMGAVVRDLNAKPVLTRAMIDNAIGSQAFLNGSNLADSVEQVKITPLAMDLDELSKLWGVFFQTPYALTVAYQASVLLIESDEPAQGPLPVLRRGEEDRGVETVLGAFPLLDSIHAGEIADDSARLRLPSYPSARMGAILTIRGRNLGGDTATVRFTNPRLAAPIEIAVPAADRTDSRVKVTIPSGAAADAAWAAGLYSVDLALTTAGGGRTSNAIPLALAPQVTAITPASPIAGAGTDVTLTVAISPQVLPSQFSEVLFAGREIAAEAHGVAASSLDFIVTNAEAVTGALLRLRVDGIDSLPFVVTGTPPLPAFDDNQKVTIV